MRKLFIITTMLLTAFVCRAFDFDGIDLNAAATTVAQEISKRGYVYDSDRNCLKGKCQGTEIFLSFNNEDVTQKNHVGQLMVEIPMQNTDEALMNIVAMFNVVYHQVAKGDGHYTYAVSTDGTELVVSKKHGFIVLTYNTPFYKR